MKEFLDYLKASGYTPCEKKFSTDIRRNGEFVFNLRDTEEEQPEVLLWCLKELDSVRREGVSLIRELLYNADDPDGVVKGGWEVIDGPYGADAGDTLGSGPTMTAAAISAVCALPLEGA